jgi:inhibitor of cysteine peptidase
MGLSSVCAARPAGSARLRERRFIMLVARMHRKSAAHSWLLLVALFLLVVCPAVVRAATKTVTDADNGKTVQIKMGDVLEVRLSSNPTTGYEWYVQKQSTALLKLTGQSWTQPPPGLVGAPTVQIIDFAPTGKGTGVLMLHYVRSWEPPNPNEQQWSLHVTIE